MFEHKIPDFLTDRRNTIRQVLFTAVFALVFINLYRPFGVDTWQHVTRAKLFFSSSLVILAGMLVIAISRIIMLRVSKNKSLTMGGYIGWIAAEIVSMAIVYVILQQVFITNVEDIFEAFKESLKITALVLLFPYTITILYFSWQEKNRKIVELINSNNRKNHQGPMMVPFRDEKGSLRFSLKKNDLLYLEAADNYVIIHYLDNGKDSNYMIRNSLKNMEEELMPQAILRCHRSYMVNFDRVKIVRKEKDGLVLELEGAKRLTLPISQSYVDKVMKMFSDYSRV